MNNKTCYENIIIIIMTVKVNKLKNIHYRYDVALDIVALA